MLCERSPIPSGVLPCPAPHPELPAQAGGQGAPRGLPAAAPQQRHKLTRLQWGRRSAWETLVLCCFSLGLLGSPGPQTPPQQVPEEGGQDAACGAEFSVWGHRSSPLAGSHTWLSSEGGGPVTPSANAELRGSHSVGRTSFPDGGAGRDGKRRFISASSSRLAEHLKEKKTVVFEKQQPYKDEQEKNPNPQIIINHLSGSVLKCFLPIAFEHLPIFIDLSIMYLPATVHTVRVATI